MSNENKPAFPFFYEDHEIRVNQFGLSKLEYFTAKAMAELIHIADKRGWHYEYDPEGARETIGKKAALIAKATLEALSNEE